MPANALITTAVPHRVYRVSIGHTWRTSCTITGVSTQPMVRAWSGTAVQAGISTDSIGDASRDVLTQMEAHKADKDALCEYLLQ